MISKSFEDLDPIKRDIYEISERLIMHDQTLFDELQRDRARLVQIINELSQGNQKEALFSLISNIEISISDADLLDIVGSSVIKGDFSSSHKWIIEYNIVNQKMEMIQTVVMPYLNQKCPHKNLFRALKQYEFDSIALGSPLIRPQKIYEVIANARSGLRDKSGELNHAAAELEKRTSVRLVMPNKIFNTLLRLAWISPNYIYDLLDRYEAVDLVLLLRTLDKIVPTYFIAAHLGYPMGGGESFMHQTCRILSEFGVMSVWVSFVDPKDGWYSSNSVTYTPFFIDVRYAGGSCREDIQNAIDIYSPDLIHAQGGTNNDVIEVAELNRINSMIGYHFWSGLIDLGQTGNRHINENITKHKLCQSDNQASDLIWKYVASEFMLDLYEKLGGIESLNVIHPISDNAQFLVERDECGIYVLQINVTALKGGHIFLDCVEALGDGIPFMGIQSELEDSDFFVNLNTKITKHSLCKLNPYGDVKKYYQTARLVIIPTLVDETFCRVAFEAAMNGIPVISTANGYLPYMLGETGVYLSENSSEWIDAIQNLYHDVAKLKLIGEKQRAYLQSKFGSEFKDFTHTALNLIDNSTFRNIGIFTTWGDQGLGNLSHTHAKLLRGAGFKVHIFSFQPYKAIGKALINQTNYDDWSVPTNADSIYYSFNCREQVTIYELTQFILANNIKTLLVPEICWSENWERLFKVDEQVPGLSICGIPMIEIVINEEILNHNRLKSTLYCTKFTEKILNQSGVSNGLFLGHGFGLPLSMIRLNEKRNRLAQRTKIRFLHVAGHNPKIRKNTNQVIEAFSNALKLRNDIELTITSMDPLSTYYSGKLPAGITILDHNLSRDEILNLYEEHDVSIQVSSHEGLGLGFYESISRCTPVLSLNVPPHNEIVLEGETGWLIPANPVSVADNERAIVKASTFKTADLTNRIVSLDRKIIDQVSVDSRAIYMTRFDEVSLLTRFMQTLPSNCDSFLSNESAAVKKLVDEQDNASLVIARGEYGYIHLEQSKKNAFPILASIKVIVKKVLFKVLRVIYQSARPITHRIVIRLRLLFIEATADLRNELASLGQHVDRLVKEESLMRHELASAMKAYSFSKRTILQDVMTNQSNLQQISLEIEFIKKRITSFANKYEAINNLKKEANKFNNSDELGPLSIVMDKQVSDSDIVNLLISFLTDKSIFVDVGSSVGFFSIAIGKYVKNGGRVFSIEPNPSHVKFIKRSVQINNLEAVVKVIQCAVFDQDSVVDFFYSDGNFEPVLTYRNKEEEMQSLSVHCSRLDTLLPKDVAVDLIKIDVDGRELNVLMGMQEVLQRSPNVKVLFRKLKSSSEEVNKVGEFMLTHGFELYGIRSQDEFVHLNFKSYQSWIGDILAM